MPVSQIEGPYIVWINHGYDGWHPTSCKTLVEAFQVQTYGSEFIITTKTQYEIIEKE